MKKKILAVLMTGLMLATIFGTMSASAFHAREEVEPVSKNSGEVYISYSPSRPKVGEEITFTIRGVDIEDVALTTDWTTGSLLPNILWVIYDEPGIPDHYYEGYGLLEKKHTLPAKERYVVSVFIEFKDGTSEQASRILNLRGKTVSHVAFLQNLINQFPLLSRLLKL